MTRKRFAHVAERKRLRRPPRNRLPGPRALIAKGQETDDAKTAGWATSANVEGAVRSKATTDKMVTYARNLARSKKVTLPEGYQQDFNACRRFLDEHAR